MVTLVADGPAMAAAANYGRANRQLLAQATRRAFSAAGLGGLALLYDVSHNLAKIETHVVAGVARRLCVHRKDATRAFGPDHPELVDDLRDHGQPVLVPGSTGTASYVLVGVPGGAAFQPAVRRDLESAGVRVRGGLAEEAPLSYKDVDEVVRVCQQTALAAPVARLVPLGVVRLNAPARPPR